MFYAIGALFLFTFGLVNIGTAYILRNIASGEPVFVWSDFFYAIKRNLKQGFFLGLIDFIFVAVLVSDYIFFFEKTGSYLNDVMYFMVFALSIIYCIMRFYIYQLLITFKLSNFKILKNSLIFSILGIKRNIIALLSLVLFVALHAVVIVMFLSIGISIPLVLPIFYAMSIVGFISTYAAYPIIDKYMIAPYASNEQSDSSDDLIEGASESVEE